MHAACLLHSVRRGKEKACTFYPLVQGNIAL
jgi:hypothetical protein